jgi:AraC-like DNA-binding protein
LRRIDPLSEEAYRSSEIDPLAPLLGRGSLTASVFYSGTLCGGSEHPAEGSSGVLHLVRRGPVRILDGRGATRQVDAPSLVLFPRPLSHRLETAGKEGADLVCARLRFNSTASGLLLFGFPDCLVIPLAEFDGLEPVLTRLFAEAFSNDFGQKLAVDLLVELLMVMLLRHCIARGHLQQGVLAGLGDPQLARVLTTVTAAPGQDFSIEGMAAIAGMSRSSFAAAFKARVGISPGDYLTLLRLARAKEGLLARRSLKAIAAAVGYGSPTSLARAFQRHLGLSPRAWLDGEIGRKP